LTCGFHGVYNVTGLLQPGAVADFPVAFAGLVQGYSITECPATCNETLVGTVLLDGMGTAEFTLANVGGGEDIFTLADYQFTGQAQVESTPEPATLLLVPAEWQRYGGRHAAAVRQWRETEGVALRERPASAG
jgi:hypothetical protein